MTYNPHILIQFGGTIGTDEEWSMGLRCATDGGADDGDNLNAAEWLEDVAEDIVAFVEREESYLSSSVELKFVKVNAINAAGRYTDDGSTIAEYWGAGAPSGVGTQKLPNQIALVATLETAKQRGKASKGRIYLPALALVVDTGTGLFSGSHTNAVMGSVKTLLDDINNGDGLDAESPQVCVYSNIGSPGPHEAVTHVSVDNRPDVQRRRANQMSRTRYRVALS